MCTASWTSVFKNVLWLVNCQYCLLFLGTKRVASCKYHFKDISNNDLFISRSACNNDFFAQVVFLYKNILKVFKLVYRGYYDNISNYLIL